MNNKTNNCQDKRSFGQDYQTVKEKLWTARCIRRYVINDGSMCISVAKGEEFQGILIDLLETLRCAIYDSVNSIRQISPFTQKRINNIVIVTTMLYWSEIFNDKNQGSKIIAAEIKCLRIITAETEGYIQKRRSSLKRKSITDNREEIISGLSAYIIESHQKQDPNKQQNR